jgi:rod shape-determining protein MreC
MVVLGAILLLVFNLPEKAAQGSKSAVRELLAPYHSAVAAAGGWRQALSRSAAAETNSLRLAQLQRLETLEQENDHLRRLLNMAERIPRRTVGCDIIGRDGEAGWWRMIRLNRGAKDGITTNDVAVTESGVLGVVREVSPHTADVLLLTDPGCRIAARCTRTGDFGLLQGGGVMDRDGVMEMLLPANLDEMTFIPRESTIREGDEIVTSGLGGVFPEGLIIGRVHHIEAARSGLYLNAQVIPAVDLARLRHVLIITHTPAKAAGGKAGL